MVIVLFFYEKLFVYNGQRKILINLICLILHLETTDEGSSFKKKKMAKLKTEAGLSHNWNSLFLGQNAVADIIAKTYNTTKENVEL